MTSKLKRSLCVLLCTIFIISLSLPVAVYAATSTNTYSIDTEFDSIKKSTAGGYAMQTDNGTTIPVGRLDIDVTDKDALDDVMDMDNISDETKEAIQAWATYAQEVPGCDNLVTTLFSPDLLPQTRSTVTMTYIDMEMKTETLYTYGAPTRFTEIASGQAAWNLCQSVLSIILLTPGVAQTTVNTGLTLKSIFEAAVGGTVTGASTGSFVQFAFVFDAIQQFTYGKADLENWYLGCATEKITVRKIREYHSYEHVVNDVTKYDSAITEQSVYKVVKSKNFDDPWGIAYYNVYSPVDQWVGFKYGGTTWVFSY